MLDHDIESISFNKINWVNFTSCQKEYSNSNQPKLRRSKYEFKNMKNLKFT